MCTPCCFEHLLLNIYCCNVPERLTITINISFILNAHILLHCRSDECSNIQYILCSTKVAVCVVNQNLHSCTNLKIIMTTYCSECIMIFI